jgi:alpha-ketoglutarate-dependent 2,4-dichlorophenoxyacetate dioxygenase
MASVYGQHRRQFKRVLSDLDPGDDNMKPVVTPLHPLFVAKITGVDLGKAIGKDIQRAIEHAMDVYAVCVLPAQYLTDEQQIAFSCLYGPLEVQPDIGRKAGAADRKRRIASREIFDISNLDENGGILDEDDERALFMRGDQLWHTDASFKKEAVTWSMLHAKVIPPKGGDTEFVDTRAAYDALPDAMTTRLEGLVAEHSLWHSRAKLGGYVPTEEERRSLPSARHEVVRQHPGSGRNALYIAAHASHIVGMPVEEGRALLGELIEFATQPQFVYRHRWQVGDLMIWDNRCTMHRATPFAVADHVRDMRRTTIIDKAKEALVD